MSYVKLPARASTGTPLIRLTRVTKDYPSPAGPFRALNNVNMEVSAGEFVAIVGRSGAGKTTLVNMVTGVDHASSGDVIVDGRPIQRMSESQLSQWRGENVGVIYQSFHLLPGLSLLDNVLLPMDFCHTFRGRPSREHAFSLLEQVGLEEHARKYPTEISGGQQQRVAIARALVNDPAILVADEPTGRLDSTTAEAIFRIFQDLIQRGKTILMVTHDHGLAGRVTRTFQIVDGTVSNDGA